MEKIVNPARIVSEVEYEHGLKPGALASKKLTKFLSGARRKAIKLLRGAGMSWQEVAIVLHRDPSSVRAMIHPKVVNKKKK